jgi:RNA polymerase sigma-70 factor (ECF subfamily)
LHLREYQQRSKFMLGTDFIEMVAGDASSIRESLESQHRALADCYAQLSASSRNLVDRRYRDGLTVKDLAEQMGRPLRTVYRLFERIHITLLDCVQRKLAEEGVL